MVPEWGTASPLRRVPFLHDKCSAQPPRGLRVKQPAPWIPLYSTLMGGAGAIATPRDYPCRIPIHCGGPDDRRRVDFGGVGDGGMAAGAHGEQRARSRRGRRDRRAQRAAGTRQGRPGGGRGNRLLLEAVRRRYVRSVGSSPWHAGIRSGKTTRLGAARGIVVWGTGRRPGCPTGGDRAPVSRLVGTSQVSLRLPRGGSDVDQSSGRYFFSLGAALELWSSYRTRIHRRRAEKRRQGDRE